METTTKVAEIAGRPKKGVSRRDFLKAGAGAAGVAVLAACTPGVTNTTATTTSIPPGTTPPTTSHPAAVSPIFDALQFFDDTQAAVIHAAAGRIIPGTPQDPGAKEAAVVVFIDRALAGYDRDLQRDYLIAIFGMEAYALDKYKEGFAKLTDSQQDDILGNMEKGSDEAKRYLANPTPFFNTLVNHTRQGMFVDPIYGGNRDSVGWKLIGHPGIVFGRQPSEQACDVDVPKEYMGVQEYYSSHET